MKTRRNHRKTTIGRRKRHVKYRVQTRINHRKGTVSSGRRHKFFKRGGRTPFGTETSSVYGAYNNGLRFSSLSQLTTDKEEREMAAAEAAKPIEQNYPDVDAFVEKVVPNNTKVIIGDFGNIELTVKKLDKKVFYIGDVKKDQPVTKQINDVTVKFYINSDGNTVVIYVDDILYGYVMIKIEGKEYESDNRGIYSSNVSNAIKLDLIAASAS